MSGPESAPGPSRPSAVPADAAPTLVERPDVSPGAAADGALAATLFALPSVVPVHAAAAPGSPPGSRPRAASVAGGGPFDGISAGPIEATPLWECATRTGAGERFEPRGLLNVSASRTVHLAYDRDLEREVELHRLVAGAGESRLVAIAQGLARLRHPSLPLCHVAGTDRHGSPIAVISHPRGRSLLSWLAELPAGQAGASRRRVLVAAVEQAARGLWAAHPHTGPHGAITPETIAIDEQGQAVLGGWGDGPPAAGDPYHDIEVARDGPSAEGDVRALGRVLAAVAWGHPPPARPGLRTPAGVFPETALVIHMACDPRVRRGYADAGELAADLARSIRGDAVVAGASPWFRVVQRWARRHPNRAVAAVVLCVAGLAGVGAVSLRLFAEHSAGEVRRAAIIALADDDNVELRVRAARLDEERQAELAARNTWNEAWSAEVLAIEGPTTERQRVPAALLPVEMPGSLQGDIDDRTLRNRVATSELASRVRVTLDRLTGMTQPEAIERRREVAALYARALLDRIEADLGLARGEEGRTLSSRTLAAVSFTQGVHDHLARQASRGPPVGLAEAVSDMAARLSHIQQHRAGSAFREAALLLGQLRERVGDEHPFRARHDAAIKAFDAHATVEVGVVPSGVLAFLIPVENPLPKLSLGPARPIRSGETLRLSVQEVLLVLRGAGREVRHSVMLERGERYAWEPDWPEEFPPGDFVYVPAGRVRVEAGFFYRPSRVERGFFIARHELTLGEYLPFLATFKDDPVRLSERMPNHPAAQTYLLRELGLPFGAGTAPAATAGPRHPVAGLLVQHAADFMAWLGTRGQGRWRYRFPRVTEWQLAMRGAAGRTYPWGDGIVTGIANVRDYARGRPLMWTEVDAFPEGQSIYGLLDGVGNSREIVSGFGEEWYRIGPCWGDGYGDLSGKFGIDPHRERNKHPSDGYRLVCERP